MQTTFPVSAIYPNNKILNHFLDQSQSLKPFYAGHPSNESDWQEIIGKRKSFSPEIRSQVTEILKKQNALYPSEKLQKNIELLSKPNTFVIVTGQQAGFFGGPLFTFFKTLSTIKWAEELSTKYPEYNFVPVFWIEIEDHDFGEIARFSIPEKQEIKFEDKTSNFYEQIVHRNIPDDFSEFKELVFSSLPQTDFLDEYKQLINSAYSTGNKFGEAFKIFMHDLFDEFGLILCDPTDLELKKLGGSVFQKEVLNHPSFDVISASSKQLEESGFHPQVTPRAINTFFVEDGKRLGLIPDGENYLVQGTEKKISRSEIEKLLVDHPEKFSPNVVLRPLFQDTVLPVVGISVGPGEMSYFMQFKSLYAEFGVPYPILVPRTFGVITEPPVERIIDKFSINPVDVFTDETFFKTFIAKKTGLDLNSDLSNLKSGIESVMKTKSSLIQSIDPTLVDTWNSQIGKTFQGIDQFYQRLEKSLKKQEETTIQQLKRIEDHLLPGGDPQERKHSVLFYLAKYGKYFTHHLYKQIELDNQFRFFKTV